MLSWNAIKLGIPGVSNRIGGPGALPGGTFTPDSGFGIGHWAKGLLGREFEISAKDAAAFRTELLASLGGSSATPGSTLITFGGCRIQIVQTVSGSTGTPTAGNVAFTSDKTNFVVTPDSDAQNAVGIYLWTATAGDYVMIATYGDVQARCKTSLTNASTTGMAIYAITDTTIGHVDGQAAATALTGTIQNTFFGWAGATLSNGALVRCWITPKYRLI